MSVKTGGPAYPCKINPKSPEDVRRLRDEAGVGLMEAKSWIANHEGMTLRDKFAESAPVTFELALDVCGFQDSQLSDEQRSTVWAIMALLRYEYADAMIAERG